MWSFLWIWLVYLHTSISRYLQFGVTPTRVLHFSVSYSRHACGSFISMKSNKFHNRNMNINFFSVQRLTVYIQLSVSNEMTRAVCFSLCVLSNNEKNQKIYYSLTRFSQSIIHHFFSLRGLIWVWCIDFTVKNIKVKEKPPIITLLMY